MGSAVEILFGVIVVTLLGVFGLSLFGSAVTNATIGNQVIRMEAAATTMVKVEFCDYVNNGAIGAPPVFSVPELEAAGYLPSSSALRGDASQGGVEWFASFSAVGAPIVTANSADASDLIQIALLTHGIVSGQSVTFSPIEVNVQADDSHLSNLRILQYNGTCGQSVR